MSDASKAVFLSYASQDVEVAKRIADALRSSGVEVWFDAEGGLEQGDEWDAKIRRQIKECVLFIAVVSANTEAREEGYFRIEWDLAAERARGIASGVPFILPVVIDDTKEAGALVPDRFRAVQWTRLKGGEVTPDIKQRFLKLWSHRTGALKQEKMEAGRPRPALEEERGSDFAKASMDKEGTPPPAIRLRSRAIWITAAIVAILIAGVFGPRFLQRAPEKSIETPGTPMAAAVVAPPPKSSAPLTEAQKLTQQARNLIDDQMDVRENYFLADEFARRAVAADPTDGEAWAIAARVSALMVRRKFDTSPARKEQMRMQGERALSLAPKSIETALALASRQATSGQDDEARRVLEDLAKRVPTDPRVWEHLGTWYLWNDHEEESIGYLQRAQAISGPNGRAASLEAFALIRLVRWDDGRKKIDQALAAPPSRYAYYYQLLMQSIYIYDIAETKAFLEKIPAQVRQEDSIISTVAEFFLRTGEGDRALDELKRMPRDFFEDGFDWRPKGYLAGYAHRIAGRDTAAQAEWKQALLVVEKRLVAEPNSVPLLYWRCVLQALTGRVPEAREGRKLLLELDSGSRNSEWFDAILLVALGDREAATDLLVNFWPKTKMRLRDDLWGDVLYAPWFAAIRDDPRLRALALAHKAAIDKSLRPAAAAPAKGDSASVPRSGTSADSSGKAALPDEKSVAVLAFANLSDDKANEYFSDGISEELLNVLAKVPKLKVAARTSSFYFKGRDEPIPEIAQKLGVAYVVEGSVRKAGNKVRITAQLIKAADGFHVWSETYDRDLTDIFAVQDEIAKNILGVVKGSVLGEAELPHTTTTKIEAYTLFLQAQGAFAKRGEANLREAIRLFKAALAIDPDYVPALVGLAQASVVLPNYAFVSGATAREITDGAMQAARRALKLDPQNAAAQTVIGWATFQFDWRWEEGLAGMLRARDLAPNDSWTWNCLGDCHRMSGDMVEGLKDKQRAWELDPLSPNSHWDLSYTYLVAGRNAEAIHWAGLAIAMAPRNLDSYMPGLLAAGRAGRFDEMHRMLAQAWQNMQEAEGMLRLIEANCAILENKPGEARRLLALALPQVEAGHGSPAYLGYCHLLLGDAEPAALWLQRGLERSDEALVWNEVIDFEVIAANPKTRPILDQPRLKELREIRQRNARAGLSKL